MDRSSSVNIRIYPIHHNFEEYSSHPSDLYIRINHFFISIERQYCVNLETLLKHPNLLFNGRVSLSGPTSKTTELIYDRSAFKPIEKGKEARKIEPFEFSKALSRDERKRRIAAICAQYPGAGSTSFFNLLTDHLFACLEKTSYQGPLGLALWHIYSLIGFFSDSIATIQSGEHFLEFVSDRGVRCNQKVFAQQYSVDEVTLKTLSKMFGEDQYVKNFIHACELLMDLFLGEMHALALPAAPSYPEDINSVFQIIRLRIDRIIFFLETADEFIQEAENGGDNVVLALEETREKWLPKLLHLKNTVQSVSDDPKVVFDLFQSFRELKEELSKQIETKVLLTAMEEFLSGYACNKSNSNALLYRVNGGLSYPLKTLFDDGIKACLVYLVRKKMLDSQRVIESLKKTKKVLDLISEHPRTRIDKLVLKLCHVGEDPFEERLDMVWRISKYTQAVYQTTQLSLKNYLQGVSAKSPDKLAKLFYHVMSFCYDLFEKHVSIMQSSHVDDGEIREELRDLHQEIIDWTKLPCQSMEVALQEMNSLIESTRVNAYRATESSRAALEGSARGAGDSLLKAEQPRNGKKKKKKKGKSQEKRPPAIKTLVSTDGWKEVSEKKMASEPIGKLIKIQHQEIPLNLEGCTRLVAQMPIIGMDCDFREAWRTGALHNLDLLFSWFQEIEMSPSATPTLDHFLQQFELLRRMFEAAIQSVTAFYPITDSESKHILHSDLYHSHTLHRIVLPLMKSEQVSSNVRKTLFANRKILFLLSQGNACINYPLSSHRKIAEPYAQTFFVHLQNLKKVFSSGKPGPKVLEEHRQLMQMGRQLIENLFHAVIDPEFGKDLDEMPDLPEFVSEADQVFGESTYVFKESGIEKARERAKIHISNRNEAIDAIKEALRWIELRLITPPQGSVDKAFRKTVRDEALAHVQSYLLRLQDKLNHPNHFERLSDSVLGELALVRRLLKEANVAALLHAQIYVDGDHIVRAQGLRYENNPCHLNHVLRQHNRNVPDLLHPKFKWLGHTHRISSYPYSLPIHHRQPSMKDLIPEFLELQEESKMGDFSLVKGKKVVTPEEHAKKVEELIKETERHFIFPALEVTLQTLRDGFVKID